jgi:hypothetical protein
MQPTKPQLLSGNKIVFPANEATVQQVTAFSNGASSVYLQFIVSCTNLPPGTRVGLSAGDAGPNPPIYIAPMFITTWPNFMVGINCNVPASYSTNLYFNAQMPQGILSSPNMSVEVQVYKL